MVDAPTELPGSAKLSWVTTRFCGVCGYGRVSVGGSGEGRGWDRVRLGYGSAGVRVVWGKIPLGQGLTVGTGLL